MLNFTNSLSNPTVTSLRRLCCFAYILKSDRAPSIIAEVDQARASATNIYNQGERTIIIAERINARL